MTDHPNFHPPLSPRPPRQTLWDDATWVALSDYVSGQATEAAVTALHARMAADPAYATLVVSMEALWALPWEQYLAAEEPILAEQEAVASQTAAAGEAPVEQGTAVDVAAAWARFEAALPARSTAVAGPVRPATLHTDTEPPADVVHAGPRQFRRSAYRTKWRWRPVLWSAVALAASVLLGVQLHWRALHPHLYYHAGATGQVVMLPDRSTVWLAPGAYLGTSRSFIDDARTVYLFGQARFAVAHDPAHPFVVRVLELQAKALGTTFTVASDTTARVSVNVHDGTVELDFTGTDGKPRRVAMIAGEQVRNVMALTRWFTKVGYLIGQAGVPIGETPRIQAALLRAAAAAAPRAEGSP
jgi:ferric-dicitrate binding protein FerR (iron transport regulator)